MTDQEAIDALKKAKVRLINLTTHTDAPLDGELIKELNEAIFDIGVAELHPAFQRP